MLRPEVVEDMRVEVNKALEKHDGIMVCLFPTLSKEDRLTPEIG